MNATGQMGDILTEMVVDKVMNDKLKTFENNENDEKNNNNNTENIEKKEELSDDDFNDEETEKILNKMKNERMVEVTKKQKKQEKTWGEYREIVEDEFLPIVTKNDNTICHFYHKDFERCKIVDKHLKEISYYHPECTFITLNCEKTPFFVQKLQIKVLPCIVIFKKGIAVDRIVGFEDFGGRDDFKCIDLTRRILKSKVIKAKTPEEKGKKSDSASNSDDDN